MKQSGKHLACWVNAVVLATGFLLRAEIHQGPSLGRQEGAPLDITPWEFRKPVNITQAGVQQLELNLDVLSHAQPDFGDLRLIRDDRQVAYILERTTIQRALIPEVTATNDAANPRLSRWILKLPGPHLPIGRLTCAARTRLFQREITVYEILHDENGEVQHLLGHSSWTQTPGAQKKEFSVAFDSRPESDTLFLETENGDNPTIDLENFQLFYPAARVIFKASPDDQLFLYYGNPEAAPPQYDLSLVANQLLAASKATASLGTQEQLRKNPWHENQRAGRGGVVFWAILGLVVVVLLVIISRLLPKSEPQPPK
jgi:hypothetical protein